MEQDNVKTSVFKHLDALRETGAINMLESSSLIARDFDIDIELSRKLLVEWMNQYS